MEEDRVGTWVGKEGGGHRQIQEDGDHRGQHAVKEALDSPGAAGPSTRVEACGGAGRRLPQGSRQGCRSTAVERASRTRHIWPLGDVEVVSPV